jgi:hypothetical protein
LIEATELADLTRPIPALMCNLVPAKHSRRMARVASTRSRTVALGSPVRLSLSLSKGTRGTSTWISIRSSSGPDIFFCPTFGRRA